jgi:MazG family protein
MPDASARMDLLLDTVRRLRAPGGCEWDRSQTVASLRPFLLEEAYEVAEAAENEDWDALRVELGDLLLHIVMDAGIAEEQGRFDLADVADGIREKLVRRHPHVFGSRADLSPGDVERQWERIKSGEKRGEGFFASLPRSMPALQMAWRVQQRASDVGCRLPDARESLERSGASMERLASGNAGPGGIEDEIGRLLFLVANISRLSGIEPEASLKNECRAFMAGLEESPPGITEPGASTCVVPG